MTLQQQKTTRHSILERPGSNVSGTYYESGWYLPSIAELFQIYANGKGANKVFDIDTASEALGGDKFEFFSYWSSSQYVTSYQLDSEKTHAYGLDVQNGDYSVVCGKSTSNIWVCCIREF